MQLNGFVPLFRNTPTTPSSKASETSSLVEIKTEKVGRNAINAPEERCEPLKRRAGVCLVCSSVSAVFLVSGGLIITYAPDYEVVGVILMIIGVIQMGGILYDGR